VSLRAQRSPYEVRSRAGLQTEQRTRQVLAV
jgi:hypothetical protein